MSSMKANIDIAATFFAVPVEALTEYMLDRDPLDTAVSDRVSAVDAVSRGLGMTPTELLLAVLDIERERRDAGEHLAEATRALRAVRMATRTSDMLAVRDVLDKAGY